MVRLNKFLAESGVASRRKCDHLIVAGAVSVNGEVETVLGTRIDESSDRITVRGKAVRPDTKLHYIMLNKPKGVVTTASDEKARKTVLELIALKSRLFPVGRLDIDSTGLLILTNDGDLTHKLTHPKFGVEKTYEVLLDKPVSDAAEIELERGVQLEEGRTAGSRITFPRKSDRRLVRITLHQGWKRQVRRMFARVGYEVRRLKRVQVGPLVLNGLRTGEWRYLTKREVEALKGAAD